MEATLLVELLTEELPPRSLARFGQVLADELAAELRRDGFLSSGSAPHWYATPRRLAVSIPDVHAAAPDRELIVKGPAVRSALDKAGKPTPALLGFARKRGVEVGQLERMNDGKQEVFVHRDLARGSALDAVLGEKVELALKRLPVAKMMRWGDGDAQFVRPVHGLVMLHGERVVPGTVLGLQSGRRTRGHRFLGTETIALEDADSYVRALADLGRVSADYGARRADIAGMLAEHAARLNAKLGEHADLLDEVTALVELPTVYVGRFDERFLDVPQECLILTMRQNQKYFPLFDAAGRLLPRFLIVSNMRVDDPRHIVGGNERVVRARLDDARFFYEQDRKSTLASRLPKLNSVVYHNKLGSVGERGARLKKLAGAIAVALDADRSQAERAAELAKADLVTDMVGEFPELQGVMGRYYALHDGEPNAIAEAIGMHYRPRFAGDALPEGPIACAVALADKLDALAGHFGIGQQPTGDKDPFGLRRAALGIVRIVVERKLPLALDHLVELAFAGFGPPLSDAGTEVSEFVFSRFSGYLRELGFSSLQIDAVLCQRPMRLAAVPQQLEAVRAFESLPEAASLSAANKRVVNILRQASDKGENVINASADDLEEPAERALFDALRDVSRVAMPLFRQGDYTGYLKAFAVLKAPVDGFFDGVMVMVQDDRLRRNRLALLAELRTEMNRVADISRLAT